MVFYSPNTLIQTGQTNTHTNTQQSSFNNIAQIIEILTKKANQLTMENV